MKGLRQRCRAVTSIWACWLPAGLNFVTQDIRRDNSSATVSVIWDSTWLTSAGHTLFTWTTVGYTIDLGKKQMNSLVIAECQQTPIPNTLFIFTIITEWIVLLLLNLWQCVALRLDLFWPDYKKTHSHLNVVKLDQTMLNIL